MNPIKHNPANRQLILGLFHIVAGISTIIFRYAFNIDLVAGLTEYSHTLPVWSLAVAGVAKGIYWLGGVLPGVTYMFVYFLGHSCNVHEIGPAIVFIWLGVSIGLLISYAFGVVSGLLSDHIEASCKVPNEEMSKASPWWQMLIWASHPNLSATYLFETGYWRRAVAPAFVGTAICGLVLLITYVSLICTTKTIIGELTDWLGVAWGGIIAALGVWRLAIGLYWKWVERRDVQTPRRQ